jgi:2-dehydro-3-deoxygluconokinase
VAAVTETNTPDIVAIGEPMIEFALAKDAAGQDVYLPGIGGDTSNAMVAAARQGASVGYLTSLGQDAFGDDLMCFWAAEGVDSSYVKRDPNAPTGIYFIRPDADGQRAFTYYRKSSAASRYAPQDLPESVLSDARFLHVSAISQAVGDGPRDAVFKAIEIVNAAGGTVCYDTNLRLALWELDVARDVIHSAVAKADIVAPSIEDARALTGLEDVDALVDFYLERGPGIVALTMGAEGALIATPERRERFAPHAVTVVDPSGAGDTFDGAFLARLAAGDDPFTAGRYANAAAALTTTGHGAVTPIPPAEEVAALLNDSGRIK